MRVAFLLLLAILSAFAAEPKGLSVGIASGGISGVFGFSGRYWQQEWGIQGTLFPLVIHENSDDMKTILCSVHLLHRKPELLAKTHEVSGYLHSSLYQYFGAGLWYHSNDSENDHYFSKLGSIGGGVGVETFWRNWNLATGFGLATYLYRDEETALEGFVLPTFDITLGYRF